MITEKMMFENNILTKLEYIENHYSDSKKLECNLPIPSETCENWVVTVIRTEFINTGIFRKNYKQFSREYNLYKCLKINGEYTWTGLGERDFYRSQYNKYWTEKRFKSIEDRLAALEEKL